LSAVKITSSVFVEVPAAIAADTRPTTSSTCVQKSPYAVVCVRPAKSCPCPIFRFGAVSAR